MPDASRRGDYGGLALVFAEAAGCADAWRRELKEWNVIQSKQVQEWQDLARTKERAKVLVELLEDRFGALPADLAATVRGTQDADQLRRWGPLVIRAASLEQFRRDAGL